MVKPYGVSNFIRGTLSPAVEIELSDENNQNFKNRNITGKILNYSDSNPKG